MFGIVSSLRRRLFLLTLISVVLTGTAFAQSNVEYEKVLLPVILPEPLPGQHGSLWHTTTWILNHSAEHVWIDSYARPCMITTCPSAVHTPPGLSFRPVIGHFQGVVIPGKFLFVERRFAHQVSIALRVQDLSRQLETWGTELPTPREAAFQSEPMQLIDIPIDTRFRYTLRVYELTGEMPTSVLVRIFGISEEVRAPGSSAPDSDVLVREQIHSTSVVPNNRYYPGYLEVGHLGELTESYKRIRLEIQPLDPDVRLWSFVSVTNNDTQHVTLVTPE